MEKKLRKNESNLIVSGFATLLFTGWTVAKTFLTAFLESEETEMAEELDFSELGELAPAAESFAAAFLVVFTLIVLAIVVLDIFLRIYIARCADAEGKGRKKKSWLYVVLAVILIVFNAVNIAGVWLTIADKGLFAVIVATLIETASTAALIEVVVSAINVKRIRKALAVQGA